MIVISVLHAFTDEMQEARTRVSAGEDPSVWQFWGIQGPGIEGSQEWRDDHSLISFRHLWEAETRRRGIVGPEVVERYPYLAGGHPERLPGIVELAELAEGAVMLAELEAEGFLSRATSDEFGIVIVLYGVGIGALNAYTFRPARA